MSISIPTSSNGTEPHDGLPGLAELSEESPEANDLYTRIASMLPEAGTAIAALDTERDRLREELQQAHEALTASYQGRFSDIETRRARLAKLMRAMGQEPPEPPKRRQAKPSSASHVGAAKMIKLIDAILAHEGQFTPLEIHAAAGAAWNQSQTYTAFRMFRDAEVIRKLGRGGDTNKAWKYTLWSREAAERMRAAYATGRTASSSPQPQSKASEPVIQALRELRAAGEERVSVQRVSEYLGRPAPKSTRVVMNHLVAIGYLAEAGREGRNAHPGRDRKTFRIANEQALTTSSEE